jgi:hypothetical protein
LRAEQATTALRPLASCSPIQSAIVWSQGQRSSSSSGMPCRIFETFAAGWNWSPSANAQPCCAARAPPTTVFPVPLTPITTTVLVRDSCPLRSIASPLTGMSRSDGNVTLDDDHGDST